MGQVNGTAGADGKVEGLKKVTVVFEAGAQKEEMDLTPEPVTFQWVAGVDVAGFTPFEYALLEKEEGQTVELEIAGWRIEEMFGRLAVPLPDKARTLDRFFMQVIIKRIVPADQREVVRAMAGMVGECGGDCCGNH